MPYDIPELMMCESNNVYQFPENIPSKVKNSLLEIHIRNSSIACLPDIAKGEFPALKLVREQYNQFLHCDCVLKWKVFLPTFCILNTHCELDLDKQSSISYETTTTFESTSGEAFHTLSYTPNDQTTDMLISNNLSTTYNSQTSSTTTISTSEKKNKDFNWWMFGAALIVTVCAIALTTLVVGTVWIIRRRGGSRGGGVGSGMGSCRASNRMLDVEALPEDLTNQNGTNTAFEMEVIYTETDL